MHLMLCAGEYYNEDRVDAFSGKPLAEKRLESFLKFKFQTWVIVAVNSP